MFSLTFGPQLAADALQQAQTEQECAFLLTCRYMDIDFLEYDWAVNNRRRGEKSNNTKTVNHVSQMLTLKKNKIE